MQQKEKVTADATASEEEIYKIDIPANRCATGFDVLATSHSSAYTKNSYDLVCAEGIILALKVFQGQIDYPAFKVNVPEKPLEFTVDKNLNE